MRQAECLQAGKRVYGATNEQQFFSVSRALSSLLVQFIQNQNGGRLWDFCVIRFCSPLVFNTMRRLMKKLIQFCCRCSSLSLYLSLSAVYLFFVWWLSRRWCGCCCCCNRWLLLISLITQAKKAQAKNGVYLLHRFFRLSAIFFCFFLRVLRLLRFTSSLWAWCSSAVAVVVALVVVGEMVVVVMVALI